MAMSGCLRARFNDARFFWQVDQKKKLEERLADLKTVTFQAKLGSYFEKTERVVALVKQLGGSRRGATRGAPGQMRPHHRHGQGVYGSSRHRGRTLCAVPGRTRGNRASHLRSLQAGQHGRRTPGHRIRPDRQPGRQMGHAHVVLRRRTDSHRLARSVRATPRRARCGSNRRRG